MTVFVVLLLWMAQSALGGGHHGCQAQQVQVQVVQQVAVPVAAIPVTTGYAVPLSQYQYSVDPDAFSNYSGYLYAKHKNAQRTQATSAAVAGSAVQLDAATTNQIALEVIRILKESGAITLTDDPEPGYSAPQKPDAPAGDPVPVDVIRSMLSKSCAACHTQGKNPGKGIILFAGNELLTDLPYARMLKAVKSTDESTRMPKPPAPAWSKSEVALFEKWVQQQSPGDDAGTNP